MKKGFFGYGRCPHCDAFLKQKDLEKSICWSCDEKLEKKKKIGLNDYINGMYLIVEKKDFKKGIKKLKNFIEFYDGEKSFIHMACNNLGYVLLELNYKEEAEKYLKMASLFPEPDTDKTVAFELTEGWLK